MEKSKSKQFLSHSGLFFNIYFIIFLLFLHKPLLHASHNTFHGDAQTTLLGVALVAIVILDFIGTIIKIPHIYARASYKEGEESTGVAFLLWLFRIAVTMLLLMIGLEAFGLNVSGDSPLVTGILICLVIKEFFTLIYIAMKSDQTDEFTDDKLKEYSFKEFLADIFIWTYITAAYTAIWETMGLQHPLHEYGGGEIWAQGFAAVVLFILIVVPMRMVYMIEEVILIDTTKGRLIWVASFILMLITALWRIY